jgi:hypothetical protein
MRIDMPYHLKANFFKTHVKACVLDMQALPVKMVKCAAAPSETLQHELLVTSLCHVISFALAYLTF